MNPDRAGTLLLELTRQGIELQAHGDRLRFRPRSAMTPELAERLKTHKPELLVILSRYEPTTSGALHTEGGLREPAATLTTPHELSLAERVETGYVNLGWSPEAWSRRLRQLADRCEALRPGLAEQYLAWATNIEKGLA